MSVLTRSEMTERKAKLTIARRMVDGRVFTEEDEQYEVARLGFNRAVDQHPVVIVAAGSTGDVATAARFAREKGLGIAVQSTGHGVTLAADDGLLVLTGGLKGVGVDPLAQTAWIGAGMQWGGVLAETQKYGLAPLLGSSPNVGVVGYTLGGGLGWLGRKYGLATDSVLQFEVVTAEGEVVWSSPVENKEGFRLVVEFTAVLIVFSGWLCIMNFKQAIP